jgi:hypothetical protein
MLVFRELVIVDSVCGHCQRDSRTHSFNTYLQENFEAGLWVDEMALKCILVGISWAGLSGHTILGQVEVTP